MDKAVSATDANRRFSELLRTVKKGQSVVVTSHGKPVAKLMPIVEDDRATEEARSALFARPSLIPTSSDGCWWIPMPSRPFSAAVARFQQSRGAKNEYKRLLRREIRESGIDAPLGGEEYAEDIVMAMNLGQVEGREPSLGLFLRILKGQFNAWKTR